MERKLKGKKVAILVADGFEQVELTEPKKALEEAGAITEIVSPAEGQVQGWNHDDKADLFTVDMPLTRARSDDYDALLLPGGVRNPDRLRTMMRAVEFIDGFFATGKPVAGLFPAPWAPSGSSSSLQSTGREPRFEPGGRSGRWSRCWSTKPTARGTSGAWRPRR